MQKGRRTAFRLNDLEWQQLETLKEQTGRSSSEILRALIRTAKIEQRPAPVAGPLPGRMATLPSDNRNRVPA